MIFSKSKITTIVFSFLLLGSTLSAQQQVTKVPSAQLSSQKTQMPSETKHFISFDVVDSSHNIEISNPEKIVIKESGTYFVAAAGQVGAEIAGEVGFVDMWLVLNGEKIPNTGVRQSVSDIKLTAVLLSQTIIELKAGDTINVGFFSNRTGLGLISFPKVQHQPLIPSIIFTLYKIGS